MNPKDTAVRAGAPDEWAKNLDDKERLFVEGYLQTLNKRQAAEYAGYSDASAKRYAYEIFRRAHVREAIEHLLRTRSGVTKTWLVDKLVAIIDTDLADVSDWDLDGDLVFKGSADLTAEQKVAVAEVVQERARDGGRTFKRMTGPEVIVNDVSIDPANPQRVLLATDRGGVLASNDAATTFTQSNAGISERKVEALLVDRQNVQRIFAGVLNDKAFGGVFVSVDDGVRWKQIATGLDGRDVFALAQSPEGAILAGTNSGIFALDLDSSAWLPGGTIANTGPKSAKQGVRGSRVNTEKRVKDQLHAMDGRVFSLDLSGDVWLAATSGGIFTSKDKGATWQGGPVMGVAGYLSVAARGALMVAAMPNAVVLSRDAGLNWWPLSIPVALTRIQCVAFSADGTLWIGGREGVYFSRDTGKSWMWVHRLPLVDVNDLFYDAESGKVLVSSQISDFVYAIDAKTLEWKWWETGYRLSAIRAAGGHLLAASLDSGVLLQPRGAEAEIGEK